MFITVRLRDLIIWIAALAVVVTALAVPYPYSEALPVSVEDASVHTLVIDAGHGGEDGGASSAGGLLESAVNLAIAKRLNELAGFFGVPTVMTRDSQEIDYPPEAETIAQRKRYDQKSRVELIGTVGNAVLLSIHQNAYPDSCPFGCQALYAKTDGSRELAELTHEVLSSAVCPDNRRVAAPISDSIYLMRSVGCTAVLVECGFLSNENEAALLATDAYQKKLAAALLGSFILFENAADGMMT